MSGSYKLLLVNAVEERFKRSEGFYEPLALGVIAALTPDNWEINIIDETIEKHEFKSVDLVAVTSLTPSINRAYEIIKLYTDQGIKTVIGGAHATLMPDEAACFADSVAIGNAESTWPEIIQDFIENKLKKRYFSKPLSSDEIIPPRRNIYKYNYIAGTMQTSRGCPHNCNFCIIPQIGGHKYLKRSIESLTEEIEQIRQKIIFFVDDNFSGNKPSDIEHAVNFCKKLIERKFDKLWYAFVSVNIASDKNFLKYAYESGCRVLMIGFEAENDLTLKEYNKSVNFQNKNNMYSDIIKLIHKNGIGIIGGFIYGADNENILTIQKRRSSIKKYAIDAVSFVPLVPYPGTAIYEKLKSEKRLIYNNFPEDWKHFAFSGNLTFSHPNFKKDELSVEVNLNHSEFYNPRTFMRSVFRTWVKTKKMSTVLLISEFIFHHYNPELNKNILARYLNRRIKKRLHDQ